MSDDGKAREPEVCGWRGYLPHPIFFVFDHHNPDIEIPQHAEASVASTPSCVCVPALASVDGQVTISLSRHPAPPEPAFASQIFSGLIAAPSGHVSVVTSENQKLLELPVASARPWVRILVDDPRFPSTAWIEAK
jgi:hypothetical protein